MYLATCCWVILQQYHVWLEPMNHGKLLVSSAQQRMGKCFLTPHLCYQHHDESTEVAEKWATFEPMQRSNTWVLQCCAWITTNEGIPAFQSSVDHEQVLCNWFNYQVCIAQFKFIAKCCAKCLCMLLILFVFLTNPYLFQWGLPVGCQWWKVYRTDQTSWCTYSNACKLVDIVY